MKVVYIASSSVPSKAANSVHVVKMVAAMARQGHDVVLISPEYDRKGAAECAVADIPSYYGVQESFPIKQTQGRVRGKIGASLHFIQVFWFVLFHRFDLVYSRCLYSAVILSVFGFRVICERHDILPKNGLSECLFKLCCLLRPFEKIIVISQPLREHYLREYKIDPNDIIVAPDGADPLPESGGRVVLGEGINIGYTGHLYPGRGIEIIGAVAQKMPQHKFHVVGGMEGEVSYWKEVFSALDNITFYGHVPHSQVHKYICSFDILLAPYQRKVLVSCGGETSEWMSPLKIFEYMSSRRPMIVSSIPVLKEVLNNGENCILCNPDDVDQWCRTISALVSDRDLSEKIAGQAYLEFIKKYTWDARARFILSSLLM